MQKREKVTNGTYSYSYPCILLMQIPVPSFLVHLHHLHLLCPPLSPQVFFVHLEIKIYFQMDCQFSCACLNMYTYTIKDVSQGKYLTITRSVIAIIIITASITAKIAPTIGPVMGGLFGEPLPIVLHFPHISIVIIKWSI